MANTYLTWTPSNSGTRAKWTFSAWVKKGETTANGTLFFSGGSNSDYSKILLQSSGKLYISEVGGGSTIWEIQTNRLFRDASAFYHIVIVYDSGQGTASNRVKIYVNGVQETSLSATSYPAQNRGAQWLAGGQQHRIGRDYISQYFGGVMSHINFSDGYALAPTVFGSTDSTTGEWKINTSPSFTLGTYGFTILKDGSTITDQSSNSNNWSLGGGTLTNTKDCPSNVFATMNPLIPGTTNYTYTNGNNSVTQSGSSASWVKTVSTLGANSGKYYWEIKANNASIPQGFYLTLGVSSNTDSVAASGYPVNGIAYKNNGSVAINTSIVATIGAYTNGDILSFYLDMDNGALYLAKNGAIQNSGNPTSGSSKTGAFSLNAPNETHFACASPYGSTANKIDANFGNGFFGTTAVSSAGTNASGNGIFEYDVPSGYTALSTKGLNQ